MQYLYPNHDYYRELIKRYTPQTRVNMNISGGTEKVKYFVNAAYLHQGGNLKVEPKSFLGYDPSAKMDRYSFRANLDYQVTKSFKAFLNLGTYIEQVNMPSGSAYPNTDTGWMMRDVLYKPRRSRRSRRAPMSIPTPDWTRRLWSSRPIWTVRPWK